MRGHIDGLASPHPIGPQLPALLQEDPLLQRMMTAFDEVLAPVLQTLDNLPAHIDPRICPEDWVDWLAGWVGVPAIAEAPLAQRRNRVAQAHVEHAAGGTLAGLAASLQTAFTGAVEVVDSGGTHWSPVPGGPLPGSAEPVVTVRIPANGISADQVLSLARELVPVHVRVAVEVGLP